MSRPSKYSTEIVQTICDRLATGEPLAVICRSEGMPDASTVRDWQKTREDVSLAIARAREEGHDAIAYRTRETARGKGDSAGDVQRDKLIVDTDFKLLAKWDPKRYGEKAQLEHSTAVQGEMTPNQVMETLVQQAAAMPTKAYQIRKWAKDLLGRIPPLEGEEP
jgi:hypothetical protein